MADNDRLFYDGKFQGWTPYPEEYLPDPPGTTAKAPGGLQPGTILGFASILQGISSVGTGIAQSIAAGAQADYQSAIFAINKRIADYQEQDAYRRGDLAASEAYRRARSFQGSQRAAAAAQGIDVNSGSAADIQEATQVLSEQDMMTIKNNAWREAMGFKIQSLNYAGQGKIAELTGSSVGGNSLLSGISKGGAYGLEGLAYLKRSR